MPSSAVQTFSDLDEYAAAIHLATVELTLTRPGDLNAKLTRVALQHLWMQRFSDNLPWTGHAALAEGRASIQFLTAPGPSLYVTGLEILPDNILARAPTDDFHGRAPEPTSHGTMSLPVEDLAEIGGTLAGGDLKPPLDATLITPPPSAMNKLQRLHTAASDMAEYAPGIIANPDAAHGLEQALIEAMVGCLGSRQQRERSLAQGQHAIVMRRFRRVVDESPEQSLFIPEICKAIGVSDRNLRTCCQEHLGMSPKRYLLLRRMSLARRALRRAEPNATSVTAIGTRYGFWDLGHFAVRYQALFGESPSATLGRQPD